MRYTVYRLARYPWEPQFAATPPRSMIAPLFTSNDLQASTFAAILWARWLNETAHVWDEQSRQWIFNASSSSALQAAQAVTPAVTVPGNPNMTGVMR